MNSVIDNVVERCSTDKEVMLKAKKVLEFCEELKFSEYEMTRLPMILKDLIEKNNELKSKDTKFIVYSD